MESGLISSIQSLSHVWLFVAPWTTCSTPGLPVHHQLTPGVDSNSRPSSWWCHPTTSSSVIPFFSHLQSFLALRFFFRWVGYSYQVAKVLEFQLQYQSFQWLFTTDFLYHGLVWSPCSPRDSQESSPTLQFKSINSWAFSFLYSSTLTSIHDYWKNHSFD